MARNYLKGEIISRWKVWKVIPLRMEDVQLTNEIPQYQDPLESSPVALHHFTSEEEKELNVMGKFLQNCSEWNRDVLSASIRLVLNNQQDEFLGRMHMGRGGAQERDDGDDDPSDKDRDDPSFVKLLRRVWKCVKTRISWERWVLLVRLMGPSLYTVELPHPLHRYSTHQLPHLTESEQRKVDQKLFQPSSSLRNRTSPSGALLELMQRCQDYATPRRLGVLLLEDLDTEYYTHSCVPNAQLELTDSGQYLQVVALYNIDVDEAVALCHGNGDDPVEQREAAMLDRTGRACGCLRCRYEVNPQREMSTLSTQQAVRLANYYLSKGRWEKAKELYTHALIVTPQEADASHALGAIQLSQGRFLEAQRVWASALECYPESCQLHPGLTLQSEKLRCYRYLTNPSSASESSRNYSSRCIVPNAHVTPMLTRATCQQILEWAKTGTWTRQRHYAVPTYDVAVHTVEPLLEWFNDWFHHEMRPLLAQQFQTSPHYFVHDAFCVRYLANDEGGATYLPLHTDESTHSFVIALNDCHEYQGGGTYFSDHDCLVRLPVGEVLSFRGDELQHGGEAVTQNARHILVAFLYHDDDHHHDGSNRLGTTNKRRKTELSQVISDAKTQKTGFSFGFQF